MLEREVIDMKAAVIHAPGAAPVLTDHADPVAMDNETVVEVLAAGLHPVVKALAGGIHYASSDGYPMIPGLDGVGRLPDGGRVYFAGVRKPFGTMAGLAAAPAGFLLPVPDGLDDAQAAAIMNPGMAAYLALTLRAEVAAGETVLVLGATGVSGQLAVQIARRLGAGRVIAAGRNAEVLDRLGADAVAVLGGSDDAAALAAAGAGDAHVVIDYLWGPPAEAAFAALSRRGFDHTSPTVRYVQVGQSAGDPARLPAAVLRSTDLRILGSGGGAVAVAAVLARLPEFLAYAASAGLRVDVDEVPLAEAGTAWDRPSAGRRVVFRP